MERKPAKMVNRYLNPRALFPTRHEAFGAALAVNDATDSTCCSYRRLDDRCWEVEAEGVELPAFLRILRGAGCQPF